MSLKKIMIVEDEPDIRKLIELSLVKVGKLEVIVCASGEQALAKVEQEKPDLILLDVMMPGMDGVMTIRELKKRDSSCNIPVIFLTAKAQREEIASLLKTGAIEVITKPFDPLTLAEQVKKIYQKQVHT